jgi:hypothetical protein
MTQVESSSGLVRREARAMGNIRGQAPLAVMADMLADIGGMN